MNDQARSRGIRPGVRAATGLMAMLLAAALSLSCEAAPRTATRTAPAAGKPASAAPSAVPDSATVMALLAGVANATCPVPGVASGGQVSGEQVNGLARAGFRTVLDLRAPGEFRGYDEAKAVAAAGLDYELLPITAETLDDAAFDRVRTFMSDGKRHPVLVHCASGNRVGVVLLPWLVLDRGWNLTDAVAVAEQGGMRPSPLRDRALDYIDRQRARR